MCRHPINEGGYVCSQHSENPQTYWCSEGNVACPPALREGSREDDYWQVDEDQGSMEQDADGETFQHLSK